MHSQLVARSSLTRTVAALGDVTDAAIWSGIPYYFWRAATGAGFATEPMELPLDWMVWPRRRWALGRMARGKQPAGFQYSRKFLAAAEDRIPRDLFAGEIISFNQHFPRAKTVHAHGGRISYYVDATFASLSSGRGLDLNLPADVVEDARELERENYELADRVITMARWTADSVVNDCCIAEQKIFTVLPGANLELPGNWPCEVRRPTGRLGKDRPFVLGFVGREWRRKGLGLVCDVRDQLAARGWNVVVRAAGEAPQELSQRTNVQFVGHIDKRTNHAGFVEFVSSCDVGCLFSQREALGISTLEFLRLGVPVAGYAIEGLADTLPPDAGFRFDASASTEEIADAFDKLLQQPAAYSGWLENARRWSTLVSWDRCVKEMIAIWSGRSIDSPVRPWLGLPLEMAETGRST